MEENQSSPHCASDHESILWELKRINKRMDDDWVEIAKSRDDRTRREGIWNIAKWVGAAIIFKLLENVVK